MTDFWFNNAVDANLDTLGNWWMDSGFSVPASTLPGAGDRCYMGDFVTPVIVGGGTLAAEIIDWQNGNCVGGIYNGYVSIVGATIDAGTFNAGGYFGYDVWGGTFQTGTFDFNNIYGGTVNGLVASASFIWGGTFNGEVMCSSVVGGTLNGPVLVQAWCGGGTFHGAVTIQSPATCDGGTFSTTSSLTAGFDALYAFAGVISGRFYIPTAGKWFYPPGASGVAAPADVRDGVFNLGVEGTLEVSADYPAEADVRAGTDYDSGNLTGTLDLPAEEDVKVGVQYDGGTKTGAAPTLSVEVSTP